MFRSGAGGHLSESYYNGGPQGPPDTTTSFGLETTTSAPGIAIGDDNQQFLFRLGADVYIEDVNAEKIRDHIPDWYRKLVPARSLVLFPIVINKKPVGLFYADCDEARTNRFEAGELNLLKTLRNQAVLAIKQHS